jgi:hypothetical protein
MLFAATFSETHTRDTGTAVAAAMFCVRNVNNKMVLRFRKGFPLRA